MVVSTRHKLLKPYFNGGESQRSSTVAASRSIQQGSKQIRVCVYVYHILYIFIYIYMYKYASYTHMCVCVCYGINRKPIYDLMLQHLLLQL